MPNIEIQNKSIVVIILSSKNKTKTTLSKHSCFSLHLVQIINIQQTLIEYFNLWIKVLEFSLTVDSIQPMYFPYQLIFHAL